MKICDSLLGSNNFTLLRLLAAFSVLYGHSYALSMGVHGGEDPVSLRLIYYWGESLPSLAVDLFFVASGFLVTASYCQRNDLYAFTEARLLRIFPGLIVAVLFCVLVVGPISTTLSLSDYFSSPSIFSYIKHNISLLNGIQFDLPSVFTSNPYPGSVNGSLWTLPIEFWMYIVVAVLGACAILQDRRFYNLALLSIVAMYSQSVGGLFIFKEPRLAQLGFLFAVGGFFYINKKSIHLSFTVLALFALITYLLRTSEVFTLLKNILFAYSVLIVALNPKCRLPAIDYYGDISYGIYIYAFPVQQLLAQFIPHMRPLTMLFLSALITLPLALLSWFFVEKPALGLKGRMPWRQQ